jgi:gliding motility-associated-like protein
MDDTNTVTVSVEMGGDFEYQIDNETPQDSPIFNDLIPGEHTITVIDVNGCGSDTAEIVVVGFPKFFSPNGDGINDLWHVQGISVLDNPIIYVYDRFGKLLKQMNENTEGWDGTYNGMILPASDYWFKLTYLDTDGQTISAKYIVILV